MADSSRPEQEVTSGQTDRPDTCGAQYAGFRLEVHDLPDERAVRYARARVREVLRNSDAGDGDIHDAELAVCELATNAVAHGAGPYEIRFAMIGERPIWCEIVDGDDDLAGVPEIIDKLHQTDVSECAANEVPQDNGHGLAIVHHLSGGRCRAYRTVLSSTGRPGKAVAFALPGSRPP
ncbi:ATP-binding protein [Actinomadura chibensis]|uniref:ATP-binding protein n=1 Tax=Actinomadura chibensis TaxID=392828 RepID=UPI00083768D0|nr:ATP-binding protein [Actinomadura chibensis]